MSEIPRPGAQLSFWSGKKAPGAGGCICFRWTNAMPAGGS